MANISVTYTFANSSTADATEVNTNYQDIIDGTSDGSKDFSISALTCAGAATFNANVTLGNATSDDITLTGRVASDIDPKTAASNTLGDSTQTWQALYLDNGATDGGAVYFNAGTTAFLKANAAGSLMTLGGFSAMAFPDGSASAPAIYTSTGTSDTGMYGDAADEVSIANAGAQSFNLNASGVLTLPKQPCFHVYQGTAQTTLTDASWTVVSYDTAEFDVTNAVDLVTNVGRFTPGVAGKYLLIASVEIDPVGGNLERGIVRFLKNGTENRLTNDYNFLNTANNLTFCVSCIVESDADDYFEVEAFANIASAGTYNLPASQTEQWFAGYKIA